MRCLISVFTISAVALAGCGERAELDRRMKELCKIDGGVKVYETVQLTPNMFQQHGGLLADTVTKDGVTTTIYANAYVEEQRTTEIKKGDPLKGEGHLVRWSSTMTRVMDEKLLGESVQYSRAGGDGFHLGHHTQSLCPENQQSLFNNVFTK